MDIFKKMDAFSTPGLHFHLYYFQTLYVLLKMLLNSDHNLLQTNEHKNTVFENHHLQHVFNLTPQNKVSKYEQADLRLGEGRRAGLPNHHLKQE